MSKDTKGNGAFRQADRHHHVSVQNIDDEP